MIARVVTASSALVLLAVPVAFAQQRPSIEARLERERIYEGESVVYQVTVTSGDETAAPRLDGFKDFHVESLGQSRQQSMSISIINGRRTQLTRTGVTHSYRLTPTGAGSYLLPAPTVEVDGELLTGPRLRLEVVGIEQQDRVLVEVEPEFETVYPLQPFKVTLRVLIKPLPAPTAQVNPTRLRLPRKLTIPWADDESLPAGLKPKLSTSDWLSGRVRRNGQGFAINNFEASPFAGRGFGAFSMFNDSTTFDLETRRVVRPDADGKDVEYWEYSLGREFTANKVGPLTFGPVTLKGRFATGVDTGGTHYEVEDLYAIGRAKIVEVADAPAEGRPADYTGAVGQFTLAARLDPVDAKVGDLLTLTLTLKGTGTLDRVGAPDLKRIAAIEEAFRVYDAAEATRGGQRVFTYRLRPKTTTLAEFPPVQMAVFDPIAQKYETLRTKPIALHIAEANRLSRADIVASGTGQAADAVAEPAGLRPNLVELQSGGSVALHPVWWFGFVGSLGVVYALVWLVTAQVRSTGANPARLRRRSAAERARRRLREAADLLGQEDSKQAVNAYGAALTGLVADACDGAEHGLTSRDVSEALQHLDIDEELRHRAVALLDECDAARYAPLSTEAGLGPRVEQAVDELIQQFRAKGVLQ